jgi:hypothetical protein
MKNAISHTATNLAVTRLFMLLLPSINKGYLYRAHQGDICRSSQPRPFCPDSRQCWGPDYPMAARARARSRGMCTTWIAHWGVLDIASRCPEGSWRKKTALGSGRPPEWAARARASLTQGGQRTAGAGPSRRDSRGGEPWGPSRPPRAGSEPRPRPGPLGCRLLAEFCLLANPHGRRGPHPGCGGPGRGAAEVRSPGNRAGTLSGWSCNGLLTQPLVQISGSLSWAGSAQLPHSRPDPCFQPV